MNNCLLLQINLAKKSLAGAELALFTDFLLKSNHISDLGEVRGMAAFNSTYGAFKDKRSLLSNIRGQSNGSDATRSRQAESPSSVAPTLSASRARPPSSPQTVSGSYKSKAYSSITI